MNQVVLNPLRAVSLKEVFIELFTHMILDGTLQPGEKLPSERALAQQLGVSRPVVHEGLLEMASAGLVTIKSRVGTVINDYRREGGLPLLSTLVRYVGDELSPELLMHLLEARRLCEAETARLCAENHTAEELAELRVIVEEQEGIDPTDLVLVLELDHKFHQQIAIGSHNPVYPMLLSSFGEVSRVLGRRFFADPNVVPVVAAAHRGIYQLIAARDADGASAAMVMMLDQAKMLMEQWQAEEAAAQTA